MHAFNGKTCTIHFNSDMSGDAIIVPDKPTISEATRISARDLLDFVAQYVALERISAIELQDTDEILGLERRK